MEIINATDGYKLGHHRMYPEGTENVWMGSILLPTRSQSRRKKRDA